MECNRDEAVRAREISEKKFMAKDYVGAKKFALKAQNLFPGLEGIQQLVATLDVYISGEDKILGETDWYGILHTHPSADDETVRKNYRKLALLLHPDKNKSIGAEGAFKLISEAWSLLSDKGRRDTYDQKRNASNGPSSRPFSNGFYNFGKAATAKAKKSASQMPSSVPTSSRKPQPSTFWTVCHKCKMQYEYLRKYLNHNLLCPNCREAFFAMEIVPPARQSSKSSTTQWNFSKMGQSTNNRAASKSTERNGAAESNTHTGFRWNGLSRTSGSPTVTQTATVVQEAYDMARRQRKEAQAAQRKEEAMRRKKRMAGSNSNANDTKRRKRTDDSGPSKLSDLGQNFTNHIEVKNQNGAASTGVMPGDLTVSGVNGFDNTCGVKNDRLWESQIMLMDKARKEIQQKLREQISRNTSSTLAKEEEIPNKETDEELKDTETRMRNDSIGDFNAPSCDENPENGSHRVKSFPSTSSGTMSLRSFKSMSVSVPDSEFHNFDEDRNDRSFGDNQVWSVYDDDDGMPRHYAAVHSVISQNPFRVQISWLISKTNSELGPLNWVGAGFRKTCGDFRVGKSEVVDSVNCFSHKVRRAKGTRRVIRIFPRKGEVWALYRNWSADWNELTASDTIHKYDMVEVLNDCNEEDGVNVMPLVKVAGFKSIFHRHLDPRQILMIPREEMFRFSHHVPSCLLTGREGPKAPKGCWELDPAAIPLELLQIIRDTEDEMTSIAEPDNMSVEDGFENFNRIVVEEDSEVPKEEEKSRISAYIQEIENRDPSIKDKIDNKLNFSVDEIVLFY